MEELLNRLDDLERKLDRLLTQTQTTPENDWVDSHELCRLLSLADRKALMYQLSKGVIHGDAIRNIGTAQRPRYRFHRTKAMEQFLNRTRA